MADLDETKTDRQCLKCRRVFRDPSTLRRHMGRKRPCAPVVDREELAAEPNEKSHCRFCGRPYSNAYNVRRHMMSCPIAARGERGMDELYAHVLKRTQRAQEQEAAAEQQVEALRAELGQARLEVATLRGNQVQAAGNAPVVLVCEQTSNTFVTNVTHNHVVINVFGRENTAHITSASVRDILTECSAAEGSVVNQQIAAARALLQAALLIYSDSDRPGNITCYTPNKRDGNALVHGDQGWEIVPVPLVLSPMARTSLDLLFDKQPFEDAAQVSAGLQFLRQYEEDLVSNGSSLRTVLIRNKDLLSRVLSQLPVAGDQERLKLKGADLSADADPADG